MRRLVVALLLLVLPLACGGRGAKKQPGERQVILQTEADDERVGRDVAAQVRAQMGMVGRPDLDQ